MLDHVIVLNERHLLRLLREYVSYHHQDRVHDSLAKETPDRRAIEQRPTANATVMGMPRLGGLHHRYTSRVEGREMSLLVGRRVTVTLAITRTAP
jgi:hypothetical protein